MRIRPLVVVVVLFLTAGHLPAGGQIVDGPNSAQKQIERRVERGEYAAAAALLERLLEERPRDAAMLYRAACVSCRLGERDRAASYLLRAVKAGWRRFDRMKRDPDLEPLRDHPTYEAILEAEERDAGRLADSALRRWRTTYGEERYRYEKDEVRRLAYATALDSVSHREMRRMVERLADHLVDLLFKAPPSYTVLIAVPAPRDAGPLFSDERVGGIYEHDHRRLIARDIGRSLRHEFVHALHYGHMERLGQPHRLWVQEGLAALYEDYLLADDGSVRFLPNERHNIIKRRERIGRTTRWRDLFSMSSDQFMARAGQLYPQVRSMFEFIWEQGKLLAWYEAYVRNFDEDPGGAAAFEAAFERSLDEVEQAWHDWVAARPFVDARIDQGDAAIGIESTLVGTTNDGVLITRVLSGSAAARSRLRTGDVIVSVDGRATRSLAELQAVIGSRQVGERVRLRARRGGEYFTVILTLRPLRPLS